MKLCSFALMFAALHPVLSICTNLVRFSAFASEIVDLSIHFT